MLRLKCETRTQFTVRCLTMALDRLGETVSHATADAVVEEAMRVSPPPSKQAFYNRRTIYRNVFAEMQKQARGEANELGTPYKTARYTTYSRIRSA